MALVEQKVEDKRIVFIDESQRDFVYADKSMLEIVIQNLITNAVKFSRTGDVITISNLDVNGKALICIEDTGVGISRENIDKEKAEVMLMAQASREQRLQLNNYLPTDVIKNISKISDLKEKVANLNQKLESLL